MHDKKIEWAASEIARVENAAKAVGDAVARVMELEDQRPLVKSEAIRRLMGTTNEETGKPHSASSAEKIVESDSGYAAHRQAQRTAEVAKHRAWGEYEAAKLRASLAVEAGKVAA